VESRDTIPDHSVIISDSIESVTMAQFGALPSALNDMHVGLAAAMTATLFSPTSC
jgi:hypothetical protein